MFYIISKIFTILLNPATWIIILLLIAYFKQKKVFLFAALSVFLVFTNGPLCDKVVVSTTKNYNNTHFNQFRKYKVAIVMGGFSDLDSANRVITYSDHSGRLMEALLLYKKGVVGKILVTGDACCNRDTTIFLHYMREMGVPDSTFIVEQRALNTRQNVTYSLPLLKGRCTDRQTLLITSALHMKRSLACFAREGFCPDFYSVETHRKMYNTTRQFYPDWSVTSTWQAVFNEWIGLVVYKIMGYC